LPSSGSAAVPTLQLDLQLKLGFLPRKAAKLTKLCNVVAIALGKGLVLRDFAIFWNAMHGCKGMV